MAALNTLSAQLSKRHVLLSLIGVAVLAGVLFYASMQRATGSNVYTPDLATTLGVQVFEVHLENDYQVEDLFAGRVEARRKSALGFERGGLLAQVVVDEGDFVEKDALLAKLDTRALEAERNAVRAQLQAAKASVDEMTARLSLSKVTEGRQKQLVEAGHVSVQRYDEARFEREAIQAGLTAAQSRVAQTRADLERVNVALNLSEIRAPYNGYVTSRMADEGTVLPPAQNVFHFEESGNTEIRVGLSENAAFGLTVGSRALVDANGVSIPVVLTRLVGSVDVKTRTQTAIYNFADDAPLAAVTLPAGALVKLRLPRVLETQGFWLPSEALVESERGLWAAYALKDRADGFYALERRPLELLHVETDHVFVRGVLSDGERIVASGLHRLVPGQIVHVNPARDH